MAPSLVTGSKIQRSSVPMKSPERGMHVYEILPRGDKHGVDLRCAAFDRLWYGKPKAIPNAIYYAKFDSRSHDAVIHVYNATSKVIETHEQGGDFRES
jgi:hypothetical protein